MNVPNIFNLLNMNNNVLMESDESSYEESSGDEALDQVIEGAYNREQRGRRAGLRATYNPFEECDANYFRIHYRMPKELALQLLGLIIDDFDVAQKDSHIPAHLEFLVALRLFASGGYQTTIGHDHFHPSSQTVVCRIIDRFIYCILKLADDYIHFPKTREERQEIQEGFLKFTRIPGIIGLIDGTIIKFLRPSQNEEAFYNFKHKHSMNVQIISDHNFIIRNIRVCPGSNNDRNVWNHSEIKEYLEDLRRDGNILINEGPYYLIGDSGYTPSPILLTPIRRAVPGSPEQMYTTEICKVRSRQEQCNCKLVNKWRLLKRERALRYAPLKVAKMILVSAVLHNFRLMNGYANNIVREDNVVQNALRVNVNFSNEAGVMERDYIIQRYFSV